MHPIISEMTIEEIQDKYNELDTVKRNDRGTYKDIIILDELEQEIDRRGYYWQGWELMEGDE